MRVKKEKLTIGMSEILRSKIEKYSDERGLCMTDSARRALEEFFFNENNFLKKSEQKYESNVKKE